LTETPVGNVPCGSLELSAAYPNPVTCRGSNGSCVAHVNLSSSCPVDAQWSIVTAGYRLVRQGTTRVSGKTTVKWDLKDQKGILAANGLYWFVVNDPFVGVRRMPILLLR
jgi:hypothetical protein